MEITRVQLTKESFKEKIQSQSLGSQEGILIEIDNFSKFSDAVNSFNT